MGERDGDGEPAGGAAHEPDREPEGGVHDSALNLHDGTLELHHACEQHPVGQRLVTATCPREEYADWLHALMVLHMAADVTLPLWMHRHSLFLADLALLPPPIPCPQPFHYASQLLGTRDIRGAQYVLHGAHRTGGRVMAPVLAAAGLPSMHIVYADPGSVQAMIKQMRDIRDPRTLHSANWTFRTLLSVMDTLQQRYVVRSMRDDQTPAPDEEPASAPAA